MPAADLVRGVVDELWNGGRPDVADELFGADFDNGPARPPGRAYVRQWHEENRQSFPDLRYTVEECLVDGDRLALRWTATGTQLGQFGPIPPTGRTVTYAGAHFLALTGGRITGLWSINDTFGKVLQLGATLPPKPA